MTEREDAAMPAEQADVVEKYRLLASKTSMSLVEARLLSIELSGLLRSAMPPVDAVVGIANGAIFTASIVAEQLDLPLHIVLVRRRGSAVKHRLAGIVRTLRIPRHWLTAGPLLPLWRLFQRRTAGLQVSEDDFAGDFRGRHVALIDDCVESGNSMRTARERLLAAGAASVTTATLCWYRGLGDSGDWQPDLHLHQFTHFYPWSENSEHYPAFKDWLAARGLTLRR